MLADVLENTEADTFGTLYSQVRTRSPPCCVKLCLFFTCRMGNEST